MRDGLAELPEGWEWSTVGVVGEVMLGRQRAPKYHQGPHMRPYLRVANVFEDRLDTDDVFEMDFSPDEFDRYRLEPGDILLNEGQTPELVGRPAMFRGELDGVCFTNSLIRFRATEAVDSEFALLVFRHYLHCGRFRHEARITTNIAHLSAGRFKQVEFPVPPLSEQRAIVEHYSAQRHRLAQAIDELAGCRKLIGQLERSLLDAALDRAAGTAPKCRLGDVIERITSGSRDWKPYYNRGSGVFLLAKNIRPRRLDLSAVMHVDPPHDDAARDRSAVRQNDVLITIVGAGTGTVARVDADLHDHWVCQSIALVRPRSAELDGRYLELFLTAPRGRRQLEGLMYGQGRPHLSFSDLRSIELPLPPVAAQVEALGWAQDRLGELSALRAELSGAIDSSDQLDVSILRSHVSGEALREPSSASAVAANG